MAMIYVNELQQLLAGWNERLNNPVQSSSYKDALSDCIYDLNQLINHSIEEEFDYKDFLACEADAYLSTIEAHEAAA